PRCRRRRCRRRRTRRRCGRRPSVTSGHEKTAGLVWSTVGVGTRFWVRETNDPRLRGLTLHCQTVCGAASRLFWICLAGDEFAESFPHDFGAGGALSVGSLAGGFP